MDRILIFDFDGVINDSLPIVFEIIKRLGKKYNIRINTKKDHEEIYDKNFYDGLKKIGLSENNLDKFKSEYKIEYLKKLKEFTLFDNLKESLQRLSSNNILIIVTSTLKNPVKIFLDDKDISFFEEILGAEEHPSKVEKIKYVKKKYPNSEYYYIGDTVGDIKEGKEANVKTVATTWGYHNRKRLEKENPDFIVDSPEKLVSLFENQP